MFDYSSTGRHPNINKLYFGTEVFYTVMVQEYHYPYRPKRDRFDIKTAVLDTLERSNHPNFIRNKLKKLSIPFYEVIDIINFDYTGGIFDIFESDPVVKERMTLYEINVKLKTQIYFQNKGDAAIVKLYEPNIFGEPYSTCL